MAYQQVVSQADDVADSVLRRSKHYLPHLARICLIATFLEDGLRMWFQWNEQRDYLDLTWRCGPVLATLFVVVNMVVQIIGCFMVLLRKYVHVAVGMLFAIIVIQSMVYTVLWDAKFFLRNIALCGGLLLLLAEISGEVKTMFAGVPTGDANKKQSYMQLVGRVLVVFMFMTLFSFEFSPLRLVELAVGTVLMLAMVIGFKTKLAALVLVAWLTTLNFVLNSFWMVPYNRIMRDFLKYDFFQTLSVIGGLLLVVALGPGGVSYDAHKKKF